MRARFLLRSLTEEDAQSVIDALQAHVGHFIEQTYGKPTDFRALIRDPEGEANLPAWAQPFATIGTALIRLQSARASSDVELAEETSSIEAQDHQGRHHPDTEEKERAQKKNRSDHRCTSPILTIPKGSKTRYCSGDRQLRPT